MVNLYFVELSHKWETEIFVVSAPTAEEAERLARAESYLTKHQKEEVEAEVQELPRRRGPAVLYKTGFDIL